MNDCLFCKIAAGEIPATVVYQDAHVVVFMDIGPIIKGHALVISREHYDRVTETPDDVLAKLHQTAKKIARAQVNGLGADGVNIMQNNGKAAGQEVAHIHVHVIPRFNDDGHHWNWNAGKYEDFGEMAELARKMQICL
ncbi:MAG TPA: HIT family protein [Pontiella sp.]|nr:HIT family protein [Pontiella sp.]